MNLDLSDDQMLQRDAVRGHLSRHHSLDQRQEAIADQPPPPWHTLGHDLGLFGDAMLVEAGGLSGSAFESMVITEELGRALAGDPHLACVVMAGVPLRYLFSDAKPHLMALIEGATLIAPAGSEEVALAALAGVSTVAKRRGDGWLLFGNNKLLVAAPVAAHILAAAKFADSGDLGIFILKPLANGVSQVDYRCIDSQAASNLSFAVAAAKLLASCEVAQSAIEFANDEATAALCAEVVGVMEAMLEATVDYPKQRQQLGRLISTFQVLQRRMADMLVYVEQQRSMDTMAARSQGDSTDQRRSPISSSKASTSRAVRFSAQNAAQLHGGVRAADETFISPYFRGATQIENQFCSAVTHLHRMGNLYGYG